MVAATAEAPPVPLLDRLPATAADLARREHVQRPWIQSQSTNVARHLAALRPFQREEFGVGDVSPSPGHIAAVNELLDKLRRPLVVLTRGMAKAADEAEQRPTSANLGRLLELKSRAHNHVRATERVWDFYFELFGQRQSRIAEWLLGCDRVALDCYQCVYVNLGAARPVPSPAPFSYMRTGFSPATYRRGIPLRRLGAQLNPFPLIQLPYHRLVNPWTLGAMLHEVSHNMQNELDLQQAVPAAIRRRLRADGMPPAVVRTWVRWNRETFSDMCGVLFGGPAFVGSLLDVIGRDPRLSLAYSPRGVHPVPYLRTFISCALLRRLGFARIAERTEALWRRMYPSPGGSIPAALVRTASRAIPAVVDAICFTRFPSLGDKQLAEVIRFAPKDQTMIAEAAMRLAKGIDPGVVPERYLISAVRVGIDQRLADPDTLMRNFFLELARR